MKRFGYLTVVLLCLACQSGGDPTTTATPVETSAAPTETTAVTPATTGGTSEGNVSVSAGDFSFAPASVTTSVGESVTWTLSEGAHTTTSGNAPDVDGIWNQAITADQPFTFTFEEPGTYNYFCRFHPDFMTGIVTVEP